MLSDDTNDYAWQDLSQGYIKNWDILLHVKRDRPVGPKAEVDWKRIQHLGIPSRAEISNSASKKNGYYRIRYSTITRDLVTRFQGLSGFGNGQKSGKDWLKRTAGPSYTLSGIANPSDILLVAESQNWDMWFSTGDGAIAYAMGYCVKWVPEAQYSSYAGSWGFAGPGAYKRPVDAKKGIYPGNGCFIPDGTTTWAAADGSVRATNFRGDVLKQALLSDGNNVFVRMWPDGVN